MDYEEAKKKVRAEKPKENFMIVQIDARMVLPYSQGVKLLEAIGTAEKMPTPWSDDQYIRPLDAKHSLEIGTLSHFDYERRKIAALLNVTLSDLEAMEKAQQPSQ